MGASHSSRSRADHLGALSPGSSLEGDPATPSSSNQAPRAAPEARDSSSSTCGIARRHNFSPHSRRAAEARAEARPSCGGGAGARGIFIGTARQLARDLLRESGITPSNSPARASDRTQIEAAADVPPCLADYGTKIQLFSVPHQTHSSALVKNCLTNASHDLTVKAHSNWPIEKRFVTTAVLSAQQLGPARALWAQPVPQPEPVLELEVRSEAAEWPEPGR